MQNNKPFHIHTEKMTAWIGSVPSLILHTFFFVGVFVSGFVGVASWDMLLLVLTTLVSLEAIYLAIFIQMTVNRNTESLKEVEEDIGDIEEDIEEIGEEIEEIQEDIEDIGEDEEKDEARKQRQITTLERITADLQKLATDIETLKRIQK